MKKKTKLVRSSFSGERGVSGARERKKGRKERAMECKRARVKCTELEITESKFEFEFYLSTLYVRLSSIQIVQYRDEELS